MKRLVLVLTLLCAYVFLTMSLDGQMRSRPVMVKLGSVLSDRTVRAVAPEHRLLYAESALLKLIFYFGTLIENYNHDVVIAPEYQKMYSTVTMASRLDPYNLDVYYFAQAAFAWEPGGAEAVNRLLARGMRYRTWDWYLPFFAGFNAAYFLKDYETAAKYMKRAAEISGNDLFTNLAARYFYEAGQSKLGVAFLNSIIDQTRDPKLRQLYLRRRDAILATENIQQAVDQYVTKHGKPPSDFKVLVREGLLGQLPVDPYGGEFQIDANGKVRTTSKFALPSLTDNSRKHGDDADERD